ncbi:HTH-type transcriptional activator BauR [Marinobacterium nitratireducens]|uniref:HTH-type transcriptional activator BauR n=1 Tax=Marinobacterium nitratireducens TaxID=518897 RepID=A0A917Z774_9GAMM|nr:LysR family transcriptional regulator [Marinobacterium nitratireducens]GGO76631.1 HTH-type transcriptional activator BauR [Marinobacterium nitratireducens]
MKPKQVLSQVSDFDLRLLRIFRTVAECGSFSAAESALGITRSAVSQHMSDLEKRVGMRLCQRGRGGFSLTDEGRRVLDAGEVLLAAVEDYRSEVNRINRQLRGELNIGIVNNLVTQPQMLITRALKELQSRGDGVRINISMSTPGEIERGLFDGRLHVGAIPFNTPLSGLDYSQLYEERSYLYCSHEHPFFQDPEEPDHRKLSTADAVVPSYRMTAEAIELHQQLNCTATASDREGIAFLILTGGYIGYLPDHYAANWVGKGQMKPLCRERLHFDTGLSIVTRKGRRSNLILETFLESLQGADPAPLQPGG